MKFTVLERFGVPGSQIGGYLVIDNWDDYGYVTLFRLHVRTGGNNVVDVGNVRIGHVDMETDHGFRATKSRLPNEFVQLPDTYFSVGVDDTYYENLKELSQPDHEEILKALRDVAFDRRIRNSISHMQVFDVSLLRDIENKDAQLDRFEAIAHGRARVVSYHWRFSPRTLGSSQVDLDFRVTPYSQPSSNIHALIGRNGAGKSTILRELAQQFIGTGFDQRLSGPHALEYSLTPTNVVVISFSPFDGLIFNQHAYRSPYHPFTHIGLHAQPVGDSATTRLKTDQEFLKEFVASMQNCLVGTRKELWERAITTLQYSGSGFLESKQEQLDELLETRNPERIEQLSEDLMTGLSSGHKIALLTVTHLTAAVTEKTLVLYDEPETHLHPPLLSALVRCISELLTDRNGMAVLATHSPVVLQEIPKDCTYALRRYGTEVRAERPRLETYGENLGELTREVFRLEVAETGYYRALAEMTATGAPYEDILDSFTGLGTEAKGLLRAMTILRDRRGSE